MTEVDTTDRKIVIDGEDATEHAMVIDCRNENAIPDTMLALCMMIAELPTANEKEFAAGFVKEMLIRWAIADWDYDKYADAVGGMEYKP